MIVQSRFAKRPVVSGIMESLFGRGTGGGTPPPSPSQPQANAPVSVPSAQTQEVKTEEDPFKMFENVWAPVDPTKTNAPKPLDAPLFDPVDPKKIQETLKSVDFTRAIPSELRAKIAAGGEEGVAASMEAMNIVSRHTMAQSTMAQTAMFDKMMGELSARLEAKIDSQVNARATDDQLLEANPIFKHPAIAPMIKALRHQIATQHPDKNPKEVAEMLNSYASNFAKAIQAPEIAKAAATANANSGAMDWDDFATKG